MRPAWKKRLRAALKFHSARVALLAVAGIGLLAGLPVFIPTDAEAATKAPDPAAARQALSAVGNFQAGMNANQIKAGRQIFIGYCAECHVLFDPTWYAPDDWERLLSNMMGRSKLSRAQSEDLRSFIRTLRGGQ